MNGKKLKLCAAHLALPHPPVTLPLPHGKGRALRAAYDPGKFSGYLGSTHEFAPASAPYTLPLSSHHTFDRPSEILHIQVRVHLHRQLRIAVPHQALHVHQSRSVARHPRAKGVTQRMDV